jgi:hypothetical protein
LFVVIVVVVLGLAGLAPLASYFSVSSNRKVTKRMPPQQLRPVKGTGFPFSQHRYHAAPELAHVKKHVRSDMLAQKAHDNGTTQKAC